MIIVLFFFLIMACHNSKCLLWVPNDRSSYSYMCVWRWTLYSLWESTLSSEWFCDTNLIRGCDINSVFCFFREALLEPLTYLKEYNCHGFRLNYILGCDILVYHSIVVCSRPQKKSWSADIKTWIWGLPAKFNFHIILDNLISD